jgi:hypothetical protein
MKFNVRENSEICPLMKWGSGPGIRILLKIEIQDFLFSTTKMLTNLKKVDYI